MDILDSVPIPGDLDCRLDKSPADRDNTTIVDGAGQQKNIEGRIKQLRAQIEERKRRKWRTGIINMARS